MTTPTLSARPITIQDVPKLVNYWLTRTDQQLLQMGADPAKMPPANYWTDMLLDQIATPFKQKTSYAIIWEIDGEAVGHNNVNMVKYGDQALMHLHLWYPQYRAKGYGQQLLRHSVPYFFIKLLIPSLSYFPKIKPSSPPPNYSYFKLSAHPIIFPRTVPLRESINFPLKMASPSTPPHALSHYL